MQWLEACEVEVNAVLEAALNMKSQLAEVKDRLDQRSEEAREGRKSAEDEAHRRMVEKELVGRNAANRDGGRDENDERTKEVVRLRVEDIERTRREEEGARRKREEKAREAAELKE